MVQWKEGELGVDGKPRNHLEKMEDIIRNMVKVYWCATLDVPHVKKIIWQDCLNILSAEQIAKLQNCARKAQKTIKRSALTDVPRTLKQSLMVNGLWPDRNTTSQQRRYSWKFLVQGLLTGHYDRHTSERLRPGCCLVSRRKEPAFQVAA